MKVKAIKLGRTVDEWRLIFEDHEDVFCNTESLRELIEEYSETTELPSALIGLDIELI